MSKPKFQVLDLRAMFDSDPPEIVDEQPFPTGFPQMTAADFKKEVDADPAWAAKLTEPVEITGYCDMCRSPITHLSPLLHFSGRKNAQEFGINGLCARFVSCKNLKVAEGTFGGFVDFEDAGIEKIGKLTITHPSQERNAASFGGCANLKIAEGTFPGYVDFQASGIEQIGDLTITQPDNDGDAAGFLDCPNLKIAEGTFPGSVTFQNSGVTNVGKLEITSMTGHKANFHGCDIRLPKEFLGKQYLMDNAIRQKNLARIAVANAQKANHDLEI